MSSVHSSTQEFACWNCSKPSVKDTYFCVHCDCLQPFFTSDVFARLGIEPCFNLDENDLRQRYVSLQQTLHPDRYVNRLPQEKTYAIEQSSAINEAYDILKDPYQRALHLLALKGHSIEQEATVADPMLLEEILDLRERLMDTQDESSHVQQEILSLYHQTLDALAQAFTDQRYEDAKTLTHRLHYLQKMVLDCSSMTLSGRPLA